MPHEQVTMERMLYVCVFYMLLITQVESLRRYRAVTPSNQCSLHHNGCQYDFVLTAANCQGDGGDARNRWARDLPVLQELEEETMELDGEEVDVIPVKKLEQLERKLVKMMEGLSVRSLRHIRQIKADLRQMTGTIDLLRMKSGKKGDPVECPPEFIGIGTWPSCYRFSTFNSTWHEAREYCAAFGANLVAMDTLKEAYILDYLIKSNPAFKVPHGWWTSGNYIVRSRRWMWTTKHHLKPIDFSRWAPGEPDARSTMHCMMMERDAGYMWIDGMCTDKQNFICEIELL